MLRLQHSSFGKELRALLTSSLKDERAIAGIVVDEVNALTEARADGGKSHPKEERLNGDDLVEVHYLKLKNSGQSIRIYFTVIDGAIYMLALDVAKRRTNITDGLRERLVGRLREIK